jgi:vitamin B12 transporter
MFTKPTKLALACAGLITTIASTQAQNSSEFNPVVISASRIAQPLDSITTSATVLSREDIERANVRDLKGLLETQSSVEFARTGGMGAVTTMFMRGGNSDQTLVILDGVPLYSSGAIGSMAPLEAIPLGSVEKIELLKGNAAALYGSGAVGGVVNITTNSSDHVGPFGSVGYGSHNKKEIYTGYSWTSGNSRYSIKLGSQSSDGYATFDEKLFPNVPRKNRNSKTDFLNLFFEQEVSPGQKIGFIGNLSELKNGWSTIFDLDSNNRQTERSLGSLSLYSKNKISDDFYSKLTFGYNSDLRKNFDNGIPTPDFGTFYKDQHQVVSWQGEYLIDVNGKVYIGYEKSRDKFSGYSEWYNISSSNYDANSLNLSRSTDSYLTGFNYRFGLIDTQLNMRHDLIEGVGSSNTGLLGLGYNLNSNTRLIGSISNAYHAPTLGQLYSTIEGGNPSLKPEKTNAYELGFIFKNSVNSFKATYFSLKMQDLILASPTGTRNDWYNLPFANISNAKNNGFELNYVYKRLGYKIQLAYTHQNPINVTDGSRLPNRATDFGSVELSKNFDKYEVGGRFQTTSDRLTVSPSTFEYVNTAGYGLFGLFMSYKFDENLSLRARADNLFDKNYYSVYGYKTPGRTVFVSLHYSPVK